MPRTVLREFTGGLSNEIDPQNLRQDQGEEAFDINIKGHALEPGDSIAPISAAGHYYYRGEWIKDSKAVSFEESGIGVVKTFDGKRPIFEEIIKEDENIARDLGPPLPPAAVITGTIVSEGTRGERPGEGSHLLTLPESVLGGVDTVQSLKIHQENATEVLDDIHYYGGQPYWIVKSGANNGDWVVRTRQYSGGQFTANFVNSSTLTHNSGGSFFKNGYFVCWDGTYIDSIALSPTVAMTADVQNTVDTADNGNAGSSLGFTSGAATSNTITGVDISDNGIISFSQRVTTSDTTPVHYSESANERWLRMPSDTSNRGCFVVFLRDGMADHASESFLVGGGGTYGSGSYTDAPEPMVFTDKIGDTEAKRNVFPGWTKPTGKFTSIGREYDGYGKTPPSAQARLQKDLDSRDDIDFGIQYAVIFAKNDTWVRVQYDSTAGTTGCPEFLVIDTALSKAKTSASKALKDITCTRTLRSLRAKSGYVTIGQWTKPRNYIGPIYVSGGGHDYWKGNGEEFYKDTIHIEMTFPSCPNYNNRVHWKYKAPQDADGVSSIASYSIYTGKNGGTVGGVYYSGRDYARKFAKSWSPRNFRWDFSATQPGNDGTHAGDLSKNGSWTRYMGYNNSNNRKRWQIKDGPADGSYKNGTVTTPVVAGKLNRLCSFSRPNGTVVQQENFSVSELWTKATIASKDNSISFTGATSLNYRVGDWIKIGQNRTNKSMHLNLRGKAKGSNGSGRLVEQTFIVAQITEIKPGKLLLSDPEYNHLGNKKYIDEDCYPVITGFIQYYDPKRITYDKSDMTPGASGYGGPVCQVIKSDLTSHVLVGHGLWRMFQNKTYKDDEIINAGTKDVIEVRADDASLLPNVSLSNYTHRISWTGRNSAGVVDEVKALEHLTDNNRPRIFYTIGVQSRILYSQNGIAGDSTPMSVPLSVNGKYHVDGQYITHIDNKDITIYSPNFQQQFVKTRPRLPTGLGLKGDVIDAKTFTDTSTGRVYVCVKIGDNWKLVRTSITPKVGAETSLLSYDFNKPIGFNGTDIFGIGSDKTEGWDIQTVTPFYESDVIGGYVFYGSTYYNGSNAASALTPSKSAWGLVTDARLGEKGDKGTPRYFSINWQTDSGLLNSTGTPTIGTNDEDGKLVGKHTFKWYPFEIPTAFYTGSASSNNTVPVVISDIPRADGVTVAKVEVSFESEIKRDIVFFNKSETLLPSAGDTGGENRITFLNYTQANQAFYVLSDNAFSLTDEVGRAPQFAYRLTQANVANDAFDASRVGMSTFLLGAPNMFNAYGPNIDFYYRASFINKWGHESAPSPLPSSGVSPLNSADDCVQINFAAPFFKLDDKAKDIEKIRLYRYGGDSSEFLFLRDIDMPVLPVDSETDMPYFPTITGFGGNVARKDSNSPFYLLKTNYDISILGGFINSNFDFTTTVTTASAQTMDGSWRVNQVSENTSPSPAYATTLSTKLTAVAVIVDVASVSAPSTWPATGVVKIDDEYISYGNKSGTTLTECTRGIYNSTAVAHELKDKSGADTTVTVVEWILEMEHRNQDTTELKIAIKVSDSGGMAGSANVITVADTSVFNNSGKVLIGMDIYTYSAKTVAGTGGADVDSFTTVAHSSGPNSDHKANALVRSYDEVYNTTDVTNTTIVVDGFGYRDKSRTPVASLHSMQVDNWPPLGMEFNDTEGRFFQTVQEDDYFRYIKAVGSMYFAALNASLRFSKYGTPEYWPLEAVVTLDSEIRCIEEHAGEGIVFTTNSVYRCRGTDPKAMVAFRVPDAKGLPAGYENTVSDYHGGLLWLTASDGIAMYQAGRVTYLTRDKHNIGELKNPFSCVVNGVYWLFQEPGNGAGYRLELSAGEMRLVQTSIEAYYAYYAKPLGIGVVVTKDTILNQDDIIGLTNSTTTINDATVTVSSTADLKEGMSVTGNGIPDDTTILSITSTTVFELSANATASGSANVGLSFGSFVVQEVGGTKAKNILWKSKKIDVGEPAIPKALGSIAIVYEALDSKRSPNCEIRGQALAAELLGLDPEDLNAGDIAAAELETSSDLYSIFTKYDEPDQAFTIDMGGDMGDADLTNTERRTILMPFSFDISTIGVGDRVWNELLADNTEVESLTTTTISGVVYPSVVLNNEPLRTGTGTIYWGNLPRVKIYLNEDTDPSRIYTLPPGDAVVPQSMDLYLNDLKRFRTISVSIEGNVRVQALSLRHYPLQRYQSATLHHSADVFYKGDIDFRVLLDGNLIYRKELTNAGDDFKEERIYLPASSFGQRVHYMNESRAGMIESVKFNGSVAA